MEQVPTATPATSGGEEDIPPLPFPWLDSPLWLAVALGLVIIAALLLGINKPFVELYDYETLALGAQARHFEQFGYARFNFQNVQRIYPDGTAEFHSRRLPLTPILLSLVYRLAGPTVVSTRLFALAVGLLLPVLFYLPIRELYGRRYASLATLLFVTWPGHLVFNSHEVFYEAPALAFALALLAAYVHWTRRRTPRHAALVLGVTLIGAWSSWEFYIMIPLVLLHWWLYVRSPDGADGRKWIWALVVIPAATIAAQIGLATLNGGTAVHGKTGIISGFTARLLAEDEASRGLIADYIALARLFAVEMYLHFNIPATLLALLALAMLARSALRRRRLTPAGFWVVGLLIYGVLFFVAIRNILSGHDFLMMLMMPFMSLATALGLGWLLAFSRSRKAQIAVLGLSALVLGMTSYRGLRFFNSPDFPTPGYQTYRQQNVDDVLFLDELLKPGEGALAAFRLSLLADFYLSPERQYAEECIVTLEAFLEARASSDVYRYYVMHRQQIEDEAGLLPLPDPIYPCGEGGDAIEPALLDYLAGQGYPTRDQGIYRIVELTDR